MIKSNLLEKQKEIGPIKALLGILKLADPEAYSHSLQVAEITQEYLNQEEAKTNKKRSTEEKELILRGALLHDIGKAFLPFGLQYAHRKFDKNEIEIIKMHPLLGTVAVNNCEFPEVVTNIILMHHALLDGTGYPIVDGQTYGTDLEVPEYVWIVAYADKIAGMIEPRRFKEPKTIPEAWEEIAQMEKEGKLPYELITIFYYVLQELDIFKVTEDFTNVNY